jgi:hypothetical protein
VKWVDTRDSQPPKQSTDGVGAPDAIFRAVRDSTVNGVVLAANSVLSNVSVIGGNYSAAVEGLAAKKRQSEWLLADVQFRRDRTQLQLTTRALRRAAFEADDAPLNYSSELSQLRARFIRNLAEVCAKLTAISVNFRFLFGRDQIPAPPMPYAWTNEKSSFVIALGHWLLEAEAAIGRLIQSEIATMIPVSVKSLDKKEWDNAKLALQEGRSRTLDVAVRLQQAAFGPLYAVKLRGLSASVCSDNIKPGDAWRGTRPPRSSMIVMHDGTSVVVSQDSLPCDLGRVTDRACPRPPDLVGTSQLRNLSPLSPPNESSSDSAWLLTIERISMLGTDIVSVEDIALDLLVNGFVSDSRE